MSANGKSMLHRGRLVSTKELVEGIDAVTLEEVKEFANRYLDLSKCSISFVGNMKDVDEKILFP
jgi:predicted Zn-dependent peptidase